MTLTFNDVMRGVMAATTLGALILIGFALFDKSVPEPNRELFAALFGGLLLRLGTVYDWLFGGSSDGHLKNTTISNLAAASVPAPVTRTTTETITTGESDGQTSTEQIARDPNGGTVPPWVR